MADKEKSTSGRGKMSFKLRLYILLAGLMVAVALWGSTNDMPAEAFFLIPVMVGIYLLPTLIAAHKEHRSQMAIFAVNLFLGWSLIGWVGALAWALMNPAAEKTVIMQAPSASEADELAKLADLRDKGILTEAEFEAKKQKILQG